VVDLAALQDQHATSRWLAASGEGREYLSTSNWQEVFQALAERRERLAVRTSVAQEQDHLAVRVVPRLQPQASFECLDIRGIGFRFNPGAPGRRGTAADDRVPCPEILGDREGHLFAPPQARIDPRAQPPEDRSLRSVSDRVTRRVRLEAQIPANHGEPGAHIGNHDTRKFAALKSPQLGVRRAARHGHVSQAQPRSDSCLSKLDREANEGILRAATSSIGGSLSRSHRAIGWQGVMHCPLSGNGPFLLRHADQGTAGPPVDDNERHLRGQLLRPADQTTAKRAQLARGPGFAGCLLPLGDATAVGRAA
jgi:hypothetical protein